MKISSRLAAFLGVLAVGAFLRFLAIGYGLPHIFNSDEPHLVNTAVSFGGGTLNPHMFKYPTLWMYLLFGSYGVFFAAWSGFGILNSVRGFGELFIWDPTWFYLIARLLSAALSLAALERVWRTGALLWKDRPGLLAAAMLAVSPNLVVAAHNAKPDSMMFFLACWAWWFAAKHHVEGREKDLLLCGAAIGLAATTQYTAAPLGILLFAAWFSRGKRAPRTLALSIASCAAAFFAGSPFLLVEWASVKAMLADQAALAQVLPPSGLGAMTWLLLTFAGTLLVAGLAAAAGFVGLFAREKPRAILLGVPVLVYLLLLARTGEGAWPRYLFAVYPAAALAAAWAADRLLEWMEGAKPSGAPAAGLVLCVALTWPGFLKSWVFDAELLLPDTRTMAAQWIQAGIPEGSTLLLDQEHASPRLPMSRPMAEMLLGRTQALGHPRRRYYDFMLSGHPGGGYELYRIARSDKDLHTLAGHAAFSAQGHAVLDVREGIAAARESRVEFVILTSHGAAEGRDPELARFLEETRDQGRLVARFAPERGRSTGPRIEIYRLEPPPLPAKRKGAKAKRTKR